MDKKIMIPFVVSISALMLVLCVSLINNKVELTDALKFKDEYESLNNKTNDHGKEYVNIKIDEENPIVYANYDEIIYILENGTGVIYFGFPECPWCRNSVPVLLDAAKEIGVDKIYYYNALSIRDTKSLDDKGNIVTDKKGTDEYYKLVDLLSDVLTPYEGLNDDSIKRLYFPTVVYVKDGKVLSSTIGTVDSQTDPYVKLNDDQYNELKNIYMENMNKVYNILCDEAC
jgi:thiol-disulfide isomerase/thioredoxin